MDGHQHVSRVDAEGVIVLVRWTAVAFAIVQTATYYRPFPAGAEPVAWTLNAAFAAGAALLTAWWLHTRDDDEPPRALGLIALVLDATFALALTWLYAFDEATAIFAVLYVVALEGAFRYGMRGALATTTLLAVGYVARDAWAAATYDIELLPASISFRMGICFLIAAIAGAMVERYRAEHRRLVAAVARERDAAAALRSLDELRSTFLASASHELRTPLTSILGFALTMQDRSEELSPDSRMMLEHVIRESRHLEQLLQDLLDIERMGRGRVSIDREPADVARLVRDVVHRVEDQEHRNVDVLIDDGVVEGIVDCEKLTRMVDQLVGNAIKYSPDASTVEVHVRREPGGVLVSIDDEGPGVPESMRASIFAPFERGMLTSAHQPGTGIGLSLVDRFARLHGGRAWVEPRDGHPTGASFRIFLPDGPAGRASVLVADEPWGQSAN